MDYIELFKKAYFLTIKHKFLWIFGFFVGTGALGAGFGPGNWGGANQTGRSVNLTKDQIAAFLNQHYGALLLGILVIIVLMIIFYIFSILSEGAIIGGTQKLAEEERYDFSKSLKIGQRHFWRFLGLNITYLLLILGTIIVLGLPSLLFGLAHMIPLSVFCGLIAFLIFLFVIVCITIFSPYSYRILVIEDKKIIKSIHLSLKFFKKHLKDVILIYLLLLGVNLVFSLLLTLGILLIATVFVLLSMALFAVSTAMGYVCAFLVGLIFLVTLFVALAAYKAFQSVVLTLAYKKLNQKNLNIG